MTKASPRIEPIAAEQNSKGTQPQRLLAVDVLRGLTITFMILVNMQSGPAPFHPLTHASWNGFTPTDLVFPTFLFLVGMSTVLSIQARLAKGATKKELFLHALRRTVVLLVLGFIVNNFPLFHLHTARYYGVLPRIGLCYLAVASLYLLSSSWKDKFLVAVACLLGYWALMRFVPVPGYGVPTEAIPLNDPNANLTAWLDRCLFSANHLYEKTRDPEGLLSTLPAIATTLLGVMAALWLRTMHPLREKVTGLVIAGVGSVAFGALWNASFPINKKLWTSSFVLYAGGWSIVLLALCLYIVDLKRVGRKGVPESVQPVLYRPLLVFGMNAIGAYLLSELLAPLLALLPIGHGENLLQWLLQCSQHLIPQPGWASLVFSIVYTLVCWAVMYPLYRKRIFLKI